MRDISIYFPSKLVFGKGKLDQLASEILSLRTRKVLIITIEPLVSRLDTVISKLKSNSVEVLVDLSITGEPYFSDFEKLFAKIASFNPDAVIGIGGGSVLDIAKLVAAQLENEQSLCEYVGNGLLQGRIKKLICLPATAGTGSEVSPNAILVDDEDGQKKGIISPFLVPDIVIVDPRLTVSLPPAITAATGIDALTHCLEAYTNKFAHPLIDLYAYQGMQLISQNLVEAVLHGQNEEARTAVALGSVYGGICLGPVNTAAVHALSYPLGSLYHLPHGLSNALLLPYVMKFNMETSAGKYAEVAVALGCAREQDDLDTAQSGVNKIIELIRDCGLPIRLREVGVKQEDITAMAESAMSIQRLLKNNPRALEFADAVQIYNEAY